MDNRNPKIRTTGRYAIVKWPEDERAISGALRAAIPGLTFWETQHPQGGRPVFKQLEGFDEAESSVGYALFAVSEWTPQWSADESGNLRLVNLPRKVVLFIRGTKYPFLPRTAIHPAVNQDLRAFQNKSELQGSFRSNDTETKKFVELSLRVHRELVSDQIISVDLRTGSAGSPSKGGVWYMPGAAGACRQDPNLFLAMHIDPAAEIFLGSKPPTTDY